MNASMKSAKSPTVRLAIALPTKQTGFTLVELMIAIVLGLLVTAAAIQLFIAGQASLSMQSAMADIQDNGNFGLNYITYDIRKTNFSASSDIINDRLVNGGVVLTSALTPAFPTSEATLTAANISVNIPRTIVGTENVPLSGSGNGPSNVQVTISSGGTPSLADQGSDQLVIQYYVDQAGTDCEGNNYTANRYVIERFFLRVDDNAASSEPNSPLALACEAGSYDQTSPTVVNRNVGSVSKFGSTGGQIIMRRVDYVHFLLGISDATNSADLRYITFANYLSLNANPRPRINSIQLGILVRASDSIGRNNLVSDTQQFTVLDQVVTLKTPVLATAPKYLRQVVSQTVAIRNGLNTQDTATGL